MDVEATKLGSTGTIYKMKLGTSKHLQKSIVAILMLSHCENFKVVWQGTKDDL